MKVLVTGANGQLGQTLQQAVPEHINILALSSSQLDITDQSAVDTALSSYRPDIVVNAAAYTAVDKAETESKQAFLVNAEAVKGLAQTSNTISAKLIHVSTDFVFDGTQSTPYKTTDKPNPLGVYGKSKLEGEQQVEQISPDNALILRTSWVYSNFSSNFFKKIFNLLKMKKNLNIICDQIGSPTHTGTLAHAIWRFIEQPETKGIYHITDAGVASWYDFACAIRKEGIALDLLSTDVPYIEPIPTSEYPLPAKRPAYSVLDKTKTLEALDIPHLHWQEVLHNMMREQK